MRLDGERLRNRAVAQDLHLVVRRDETCGDERVDRNLRERFLGCQLLERREVDGLEFNSFQIRETELGEATLKRHLATLEAELARVTRTRLCTLVSTGGGATVTRTCTAADSLVVVR